MHISTPAGLLGIVCTCGFLLGSIPFGWIVAKFHGKDIRTLGSGNIGMTNVWRTLGWKPGLLVLILDALKGAVAVFVAVLILWKFEQWFYQVQPGTRYSSLWAVPAWGGMAAILGHTFSPWLRFRGGKGVATGLGAAIALYQIWILIPLVVFTFALLVTRMVSVSSILAALTLALLGFVTPYLEIQRAFGVLVFILVLYTHRSNIRRILNGTENKVSFGRKPK